MEIQNEKCSLNKHAEINAISFCPECNKFFCDECLNFHTEMFEEHKTIDPNQKSEIFIDKCKIENHNAKLEFYCKDHNTLCCALCTSKIKEYGYGQHSDYNIIHIKEIN